MPILPSGHLQRIEFVESHAAAWNANAVAIGLTAAQVTALTNAAATARAAYNDSLEARQASKAATASFHNLTRAMADLASDAIKAIKLKAAQTNDPEVFTLAQIPAPLPPSPPPPVEPPTDLVADPNADGTITLKWKGSTAYNTWFSVWRKLENSPTWVQIGSTAVKEFVDSSVPANPIPASLTYAVRSQRVNEISGNSVQAEVIYGGPGGSFIAGVAGFVGGAEGGTLPEAA